LSQEIRLESPVSDHFEYTVGAFYQRGTYSIVPELNVDGSFLGTVKVGSLRTFEQTSSIWSGFAEGKWHLNDAFTLVGGLRYTNEDKSAFKQNTVMVFGTHTQETSPMVLAVSKAVLGSVNFSADLDRSESNLSPSLALQYSTGAHGMAYAKVTQGFKSGGFDVADQSGLSLEYQGEEATSYEMGWKNRFLDNRAEVNLAIFRTDFKDLQVSAFDGVRFLTTNAAAALSQGVEVNGRWQITPALYFTGSAAYTDATYQNYKGAVCTAEQKAAVAPAACLQDLSGRPLFASSKWSGNVNLEHVADLPGGLSLQSNLGVNYRSKHYLATDLAEASLQNGYASVDAGMAVVSESNRWRAGFLVKNLTDERAMGYVMNVPIFSGARVASIIPPRTFGFSVTLNY
ncbi:MAG: TonB-dependent receptor, partial [Brevundimonas sp.]|nr:TonB-dependent receptor [Brevundimonas sp.]